MCSRIIRTAFVGCFYGVIAFLCDATWMVLLDNAGEYCLEQPDDKGSALHKYPVPLIFCKIIRILQCSFDSYY
ncbi:MAG: hypothetical protein HRT51_18135 [Colwellia sp.]|nr:hypothetical protein [Colwellia sp.]